MVQWWVFSEVATGRAVSTGSDDSAGYAQAVRNPALKVSGPFTSQLLAQQSVGIAPAEPIPPAITTARTQLAQKPSSAWTLADVADWLKGD